MKNLTKKIFKQRKKVKHNIGTHHHELYLACLDTLDATTLQIRRIRDLHYPRPLLHETERMSAISYTWCPIYFISFDFNVK